MPLVQDQDQVRAADCAFTVIGLVGGSKTPTLPFWLSGAVMATPPVPASPQPRKPSSHEPVPRASRNFFLLSCLFLSYFDSIHMVEELPTYPPCSKALAAVNLPTYLTGLFIRAVAYPTMKKK